MLNLKFLFIYSNVKITLLYINIQCVLKIDRTLILYSALSKDEKKKRSYKHGLGNSFFSSYKLRQNSKYTRGLFECPRQLTRSVFYCRRKSFSAISLRKLRAFLKYFPTNKKRLYLEREEFPNLCLYYDLFYP